MFFKRQVLVKVALGANWVPSGMVTSLTKRAASHVEAAGCWGWTAGAFVDVAVLATSGVEVWVDVGVPVGSGVFVGGIAAAVWVSCALAVSTAAVRTWPLISSPFSDELQALNNSNARTSNVAIRIFFISFKSPYILAILSAYSKTMRSEICYKLEIPIEGEMFSS